MIKKADIILAVALIILSVVFIICFSTLRPEGNRVVITINNEVFGEYSLSEDAEIEVKTDLGFNKVIIKEGKAWVVDADCPDKYCVAHNKIESVGEMGVCLPHKLVVEIRGGDNG